MKLWIGTSGYSYPEWKGAFYPGGISSAEMLRHYSRELDAVEINNTFYRMPKPDVLQTWRAQVPDHFVFAIKASRRLTHQSRLLDTGNSMEFLASSLKTLDHQCGVVLFQLPPNFKKDLDRLSGFLKRWPASLPAAFEFRHDSWFAQDVFDALSEFNVALCGGDESEERWEACPATADFGYLRLREPQYEDSDLAKILEHVHAQAWQQAFLFFKHEDAGAGPLLATRLKKLATSKKRRWAESAKPREDTKRDVG